jgi:hypothetical protein
MLPKNKLRQRRLDRLLIFPDEEHPHALNITRHYDLGESVEEALERVLRREDLAAVDSSRSDS